MGRFSSHNNKSNNNNVETESQHGALNIICVHWSVYARIRRTRHVREPVDFQLSTCHGRFNSIKQVSWYKYLWAVVFYTDIETNSVRNGRFKGLRIKQLAPSNVCRERGKKIIITKQINPNYNYTYTVTMPANKNSHFKRDRD